MLEAQIRKIFEPFSCQKEKDVQKFLYNNSYRFQLSNLAKTYLIFIENNHIIAGYFSLTLKAIQLKGNISNSLYKQIFGMRKSLYDKPQKYFSTFLISQLGRNTGIFSSEDLKGDTILNFAMAEIKKAQKIIGGRICMVECTDNIKLLEFYERNGFKKFQINNNKPLMQLIKKIA